MTLADADARANEFIEAIKPFCVPGFCEKAGSVRRRVPNPGDIEIVATPIMNDFEKLDGLRKIVNGGRFGPVDIGAFPSRYTRIKGPSVQIDCFWQSRETFGLNFFIRTGPAEYVARALAFWKTITTGGYSEGAVLHLIDGTPIQTRTEQDVFDMLDHFSKQAEGKVAGHKYRPVKWLAPEKRR